MGIVFKQSFKNTVITYLGFAVGAVNVLFLYTNFLSEDNYGLVAVILSISSILMPVLAFGVPNTIVKYYSSYTNPKDANGFLSLMVLLPLVALIPIGLCVYLFYEEIGSFLSDKNAIVKDYLWYIFLIGMAMAYFEVFYGWAKVNMKTVFGNFMKEVFSRVGATALLLLLHFDVINLSQFFNGMVIVYMLRVIIMKMYAYWVKTPKLIFQFPSNTKQILIYSSLIILGGSTAIILLEVDKVMLNQFVEIKNVAYYSVAGFIAAVIAVPARSMHQITYPLTAKILNSQDSKALKSIYQKTSLNLLIIAGLIFLLIFLNLHDLYKLLPKGYSSGFLIVFWVGLAKVYDAMLGNNNAILFNSNYYKTVLMLGVFLAIITILFNLWLIPIYGIKGAAIASFLAFFIYNTLKLIYVKLKFGIVPFTKATVKVIALLLTCSVFFYIELDVHPMVNIAIKSLMVTLLFLVAIHKLKISPEINKVIKNASTKIKRS